MASVGGGLGLVWDRGYRNMLGCVGCGTDCLVIAHTTCFTLVVVGGVVAARESLW